MTFLSALAAFYAYDRLGGKTSFKRAALAALAGSAVAVVEAFAVAGIGAYAMRNTPTGTVSGLSPDHYPGVLPAHGGIPKNVYTRMPSVPNIGMAFGQL
jgi:hypothetical protein